MTPALVLNATFEPLSVVSTRRALVLVLTDKADVVHATDARVRSERLELAVPSVVKLRNYVRTPFGRRCALSRRGVFARDGHRCQYCGGRAESIDHVHPRSRGGAHSWDNVVAACRRCNAAKRDRLLSETTFDLARPPVEPPLGSWVALSVSSVPSEWQPYLPAWSPDRGMGSPDRGMGSPDRGMGSPDRGVVDLRVEPSAAVGR
jgi:5-methylcytosine-specific restriction endonuclease McrA